MKIVQARRYHTLSTKNLSGINLRIYVTNVTCNNNI